MIYGWLSLSIQGIQIKLKKSLTNDVYTDEVANSFVMKYVFDDVRKTCALISSLMFMYLFHHQRCHWRDGHILSKYFHLYYKVSTWPHPIQVLPIVVPSLNIITVASIYQLKNELQISTLLFLASKVGCNVQICHITPGKITA